MSSVFSEAAGEEVPGEPFVHERALVETDDVGPGTRIWAFAHVMQGARIGADCNVCDHTYVEGDVVVGDRVTIKSGVYLWNGLRVEDDVFLGPMATFTNDRFPRSKQHFECPVTTVRSRRQHRCRCGHPSRDHRGQARDGRRGCGGDPGCPRLRGGRGQSCARGADARSARRRSGSLAEFLARTPLKTRVPPWCEILHEE
jgi:hypothetical protein